MNRRAKTCLLIVSVMLVASVFWFVLCDVPGALTRAGPYEGLVVEAESGRPVQDAYVLFFWGGEGIGGSAHCMASKVVRTNTAGRFRLGWQGLGFALSPGWTRIAPPSVGVLALGYRPWGEGKDRAPGTAVTLSGSPFSAMEIPTIGLTSMHGQAYGDEDWFRLPSCSVHEASLIQYAIFRANWGALCTGHHEPLKVADFLYLVQDFPDSAIVARAGSENSSLGEVQTIKGLRDRLSALSRAQGPAAELPSEQRDAACQLANVRMPLFEDYGR